VQRGSGCGDAVGEHELGGLLDADTSGADAAVFQPLGDTLERAFVFLPHGHVGVHQRTERELFAGPIFFEPRTHDVGISGLRDDYGKEPFAVAPADAREIQQRRAAGEHDGVDVLFRHDRSRAFDAHTALVNGNGPRPVSHRRQRGDARRQRGGSDIAPGTAAALRRDAGDRQSGGCAGQPHERAAGHHK